jgi:hypothetical protein
MNCGNCHRCLDGVNVDGFPIIMTMMIVCPDCGNKRCPCATDHRLKCTGNNEVGQIGSMYSAINFKNLEE